MLPAILLTAGLAPVEMPVLTGAVHSCLVRDVRLDRILVMGALTLDHDGLVCQRQ